VQPDALLDGVGPSLGVRAQRGKLIWMTDERDHCLAQDMTRGDEPRTEEKPGEHSDLDFGQIAVVDDVGQDAIDGVVVA
jgi:hypothetical protein